MHLELLDNYRTKVKFSESNSGYFRVDFKGEDFPEKDDGLGNKIPNSIAFTVGQARIIHAFLSEFLRYIEE